MSGIGDSPCCSIVAIEDIHLCGVSIGWQTPVDHIFCFSLRLPTLDPGNKAKVGGSSEGRSSTPCHSDIRFMHHITGN